MRTNRRLAPESVYSSRAEILLHFHSKGNSPATFLKPNRNCNITKWLSGCEPGWACSAGLTHPVDFTDSHEIPARTSDCQPCCEGFFCPQGLTCMIPCPLGSYCPLATFNVSTSLCDHIFTSYLLEGQIILVEVLIFGQMLAEAVQCSVPAGSYCPTNTQEIPCASGHYCRMGSTTETRCYKLTSCVSNTTRQNITQYGLMLIKRRYARSREVAVKSVKENAQAQARWLAAKDAIKKRAIEMSHSFSRRNVVQPGVQIFRYAYSQLEKEKAEQQQNRDLSFSAAVSMAINSETRSRPTIEIAFRDLMVTLKQKKKTSFKVCHWGNQARSNYCSHGSIRGRKNNSAFSTGWKKVGCSIAGLILINGKVESIRSYKKIVGFVPQDDVVHGNLTVEENIWFSANCRSYSTIVLKAYLAKADKVLVVERVIESLGLQPVRDYLVGTVEKRGISGGQRKRVNVGLELVMEPSLLFLDEPTSGLDSSSSQLLLRALKREALEGVNICMVVHQPSLTVYHGAVKDVEDYFAQLGLVVPERINPPDYFIDVLEGMVKPSTSSGVTYEELPLRWMLHKGYPVPPDMQNNLSAVGMPAMMSKQRLREARIQSIDYLILLLAALLCKIAALRTFALDKLEYRRERASGISSLAHFVAKDTIDHFNTLIKPLVYLSMFYFFSNPRSLFLDNYIVLLCLVYCVTGVAYALAIFLEPGPSQLVIKTSTQ
ncbi:UNVERIFIED_CONTAM: ABC transporter G family member 28 [Sesamum radiatum]|uniref:ABC transporter G family member 28 n=1 Tax=Sesamum radiatum TaxID=300843 RepID=A0AAW2JWK7_SESRA